METVNASVQKPLEQLLNTLFELGLVRDTSKQTLNVEVLEKACNCKIDFIEGVKTIDGPSFYWQIVCNQDRQIYRIVSENAIDLLNTLNMLLNKNT